MTMAYLRNGLCGLAAWAMTCLAVAAFLPFPSVPDIASRFRYFADRKDEFDTLFIGSSRIRYQIVPQQFDAETAAQGVATHSFNLGCPGMWPPESFYFLRQLLALHPRNLHQVVIELMSYRFGEADHQPATMRMVYWHDARDTATACWLVLESPLPVLEKMSLLARHGWLFLQRMTNIGRGAEWAQDRYFPAKNRPDLGWTKRAGFDPEMPSEWTEEARAAFAQQTASLIESLPPQRISPALGATLREIIEEVHRAGAEPIFIIPPTMRAEENLALDIPPGMTVWAFNKPGEYPQLYVPELHYDQAHLNEKGAQEWTSLLARRFAESRPAR